MRAAFKGHGLVWRVNMFIYAKYGRFRGGRFDLVSSQSDQLRQKFISLLAPKEMIFAAVSTENYF